MATPLLSSNTSLYVRRDGGQNWNNYDNPDDPGSVRRRPTSSSTRPSAPTLMNQIDAVLWDDMATLPLFQFQEMIAYSDTVQNVIFNGPLGVTWNANEWALAA